ncbi:MAG: hypothetical protein ABI584_14145 [Acidobacteriota bacterium]
MTETVSDDAELDRLRKEAAELRDLVRALSAALVRATAALPLDAALALARSESAEGAAPFRLTEWHEGIEVTRGDVASEMALLWKRLPPRENA